MKSHVVGDVVWVDKISSHDPDICEVVTGYLEARRIMPVIGNCDPRQQLVPKNFATVEWDGHMFISRFRLNETAE